METINLILDENNYVTDFCIGGQLVDDSAQDYEVAEIPEDFTTNYTAYRLEDTTLVLDDSALDTLESARQVADLRLQRETICFPIINRGELWYNRLTDEQTTELNEWYQAWLDVTETLTIPDYPSWLAEID